MTDLDHIFSEINQADKQSKARSQWSPDFCGAIDIRIANDGRWYHDGQLIRRQSLVKLFASVLRKEGDRYFLVTPVEKLEIQVEDAPFVATIVDVIEDDNRSAIVFITNLDERVVVDELHPIQVDIDSETQTPRPYVYCRDGLNALISRNAFYELVNMSDMHERDGKTYLTINSMGHDFELGSVDPADLA